LLTSVVGVGWFLQKMIPDIHKALKGHPLAMKFAGMVMAFCFYDYMCDHMYHLFQEKCLHSYNHKLQCLSLWWYFAFFLASSMHVMQFLESECIDVKVKGDRQSSGFLTLL